MAQKNASPTREQSEVLKRKGLKSLEWSIVKDFQNSMIARNRITGEFRVIEKK